jgi:hypothetical protein
MKKIIGLLAVLLIAGAGIGYYLFRPVYALDRYILTANSKPQPALVELLKLEGLSADNSLESVVAATQTAWLNKNGLERFEVQDTRADRKKLYQELFKKLGLADSIHPTSLSYDYVCVHGALVLAFRARLAYLIALWQKGIKFKQIVFLTGERALHPERESIAELCDTTQTILPIRKNWQFDPSTMPYKTETDMEKLIYDQAEKPEGFEKIPVLFVDAPGYANPDGTRRRADTKSTLLTWLAHNPAPGKVLAITHQPYIGYQDSIMRTYMPDSFTIETVGFAIPEKYKSVSDTLDSLTRWLYQERMRQKIVAQKKEEKIAQPAIA